VWERALWSEEAEEWTLPRVKPRPGLAVRAAMANHTRQPPAPQASAQVQALALAPRGLVNARDKYNAASHAAAVQRNQSQNQMLRSGGSSDGEGEQPADGGECGRHARARAREADAS